MRIRLLSVGKPRDPIASRLHDEYAERIRNLGVRYETDWVADVKPGGRFSDDHVMAREARGLLERVDGRGTLVALDAGGEMLTSRQLADVIERWATPRLTLVVGGPLGLHASLLARADRSWSLSTLTFPHELVRGLVTEQLYRAVSIRRGVPYHK